METVKLKVSKSKNVLARYIVGALSVIAILLMVYYVVTRAFPMLVVSEETYGNYFLPRAVWLFPHIVLGILASLIGPVQFIPSLRTRYLRAHRILGRVYVVSVILAGMSGMYLATTSGVNLPYAVGLFGLGFFWATSAIMAFLSIKNKKVVLHQEWMVRSYIITFAFVTFRFVEDILMALEVGSRMEILVLMSWASWAVPLFIGELVMQGMKIKKA